MKEKIEKKIFDFFITSKDFNGIPLREISRIFHINYKLSIDLIKELVLEDKVSIQSSTNPHIIGHGHYPIRDQVCILENAKNITLEYKNLKGIKILNESTKYPICLYPSKKYLCKNRNLEEFGYAYYSKKLAIGEPQLKLMFFDIDVLDRYYVDPRFDFDFNDYSGRISCKHDELYNPLTRNEDNIYLNSFGIGFDKNNNRVAVVLLRDLHNLSAEHQIYWKGKEANNDCKVFKAYYQNIIEGAWCSSHSIFSAFLAELKCLNEISQLVFNVNLFYETFENKKRPKEFTFFFVPTIKNYEDFIHLLDKIISENINREFFSGKIDLYEIKERNGIKVKENKGTLRLLEEWLTSNFKIHGVGTISDDIIKPLKRIRRQRQLPAHKINQNNYDTSLIEKQRKAISEAYNSIKQLRRVFHLHPKAKEYELPKWLEHGEIINL